LAFLPYNHYAMGEMLQRFCTSPMLIIAAEALHNASLGMCYADKFLYNIS